ncbi:hypothetical protein COLO4_36840 [Corchorus olitorius]|uniref:Uncharacterized protein n=1 Tax=Corchorus olitorius TaxID=93759 RepID=A0A1R3G523_9ROSI|nr:hypothetical protein COLO4_36840 [Corchorus olitorius]
MSPLLYFSRSGEATAYTTALLPCLASVKAKDLIQQKSRILRLDKVNAYGTSRVGDHAKSGLKSIRVGHLTCRSFDFSFRYRRGLGGEIKEGAEWGIPIQWWEINSSKKNDSSDLVLSDEEETHVYYLQQVRHTPEQLCHRTRLYLCGIGPPPYSYDDVEMEIIGPLAINGVRMVVDARGEEGHKLIMGCSKEARVDYVVYNLINGRLELDPNPTAPEASPELFGEELDPELPMDKDKSESQDKAQEKKRPAEHPPKDNMPKKSRAAHEARSAAPESLMGVSSSKPSGAAGTSSSTSKATSAKDSPSRGERPLVGREGSHAKHSVVPPRGKRRGSLDFLCDLMTQLKLGDPREIATVEDLEDDECVVGLAAFANKYLCRDRFLATVHKSGAMLSRGCIFVDRPTCWR